METRLARSRRKWSRLSSSHQCDFCDISQYTVELKWPKAVTNLGAYRFVRLARDKDRTLPRLRITGIHTELTGISEQVDFAADEVDGSSLWTRLRLQTMLRPQSRSCGRSFQFVDLVEAAAAAPDDAAASESKRRRIVRKRPAAGPNSASHVFSRGDDAETAIAARPATVYSAENEAAPADNAQPATGTPLADAASASGFLHSRLLSSEIGRRFRSDIRFEADLVEYQVAWGKPLGKGTFGTVYPGIASGVAQKAVAIKLFESGHVSE